MGLYFRATVNQTLNNITPSQSISDRDNYTVPVFSQALFTNNGALNAVNSTSEPTLSTVMSPPVYQLPSLNNQLYPLPATHSSQQTTESDLHSHSTSFTVPSNDIQVPSTNIQQTHSPLGLFHQPVFASGSALHPTPAQGTLHDIFSGTCVTNTNPYNYSRQSISKPLTLGISPKIKAQIW